MGRACCTCACSNVVVVHARVHAHGRQRRVGGEALKGERQVYQAASNSFRAVPVYNRYALMPGDTLHGPALVEENESTAVLGAGDVATLDAAGNLVVRVGA